LGSTAVRANNDCGKGGEEEKKGIDIHPRVLPSNFSAVLASTYMAARIKRVKSVQTKTHWSELAS